MLKCLWAIDKEAIMPKDKTLAPFPQGRAVSKIIPEAAYRSCSGTLLNRHAMAPTQVGLRPDNRSQMLIAHCRRIEWRNER